MSQTIGSGRASYIESAAHFAQSVGEDAVCGTGLAPPRGKAWTGLGIRKMHRRTPYLAQTVPTENASGCECL